MKVFVENAPELDRTKMVAGNKRRVIIIAVAVILVIAAGLDFWYWSKSKQAPSSSLGSQIFDKTQNQLEGRVPDTNPFKDQKNPLDAIYQNPFK